MTSLLMVTHMLGRYKKTLIVAGVLGSISGTIFLPAEAAIPVIDVENIQQQVKTLMETIKITGFSGQTVSLQLQEIEGLPKPTIVAWIDKWNEAAKKINDIMGRHGGVLKGTTGIYKNAPDILNDKFPYLTTDNLPESIQNEKQLRMAAAAVLSNNNKDTLQAYQELVVELDQATKELKELTEANSNAIGAKQTAQIANQIAAVNARIHTINTSMQALAAQQQLMKNEAEVRQKQNEQAVRDASVAANDKYTEEMSANLKLYSENLDNPWEKYSLF